VNPLSLITLLAGFIFAFCGLIFRFFPPKKINLFYGYRTSASMQNQETWQLANQFAARLMVQLGLLLAAVGIITFILPPSPFTGVFVGIALVLISAFMQFYFTEKHIRKTFDEHGNKRK
jgi:uncharacterized membrane protein